MGVSKNSGTNHPILIGCFHYKPSILRIPLFLETPMCIAYIHHLFPMPSAKSLTLLVNSFHRLGSTDEECCERTEICKMSFFFANSKFENLFLELFFQHHSVYLKFQNYPRLFWEHFQYHSCWFRKVSIRINAVLYYMKALLPWHRWTDLPSMLSFKRKTS